MKVEYPLQRIAPLLYVFVGRGILDASNDIFPFGKSENRSDFRRCVREAAPYEAF